MKKLKVMSIVGTRPEIIRLARVMARLDDVTDHVLVHTGQNYDYELNEIFFKELGIPKPNHFLNAAGGSAAETIGNTIIEVDKVLEIEKPEAVLVLGDTNSCLSVIPAKRRKIPIFHMEAGNRCFDFRVPEEINRRIVDHVSDVNLCYSEHARRYLISEGLPPDRVIKTGSPMQEVLGHYKDQIDASDVLTKMNLEKGKYFTVSIHREENVDNAEHLESLVDSINGLAGTYKLPLVFSVHPRTRKRLEECKIQLDSLVKTLPPMGFFDYNHLQQNAFCAVSDSGTIAEESSILEFPAVTIREAHERPEAMDEGVVVMTGLSKDRVLQAVSLTKKQFKEEGSSRIPYDYSMPMVSWKVAKIILSYTDYIDRKVWCNY